MKKLVRSATTILMFFATLSTSSAQSYYETKSSPTGNYSYSLTGYETYYVTIDLRNNPNVKDFIVRVKEAGTSAFAYWSNCAFSCYPDFYSSNVRDYIFPLTNGMAYVQIYGTTSTKVDLIWPGSKNDTPSLGTVSLMNINSGNDLVILDGKNKTMGTEDSYVSDYTKAPLLIKNNNGYSLGLSPTKISSSTSLGVTSGSIMTMASNSYMYFKSGTFTPLTLTPGGQVAIGSTSATAMLDVYNIVNPNLKLRTSANGTLELGIQTSAGNFATYAQTGDAVIRKTSTNNNIFFNIPNTTKDGNSYLTFGDNGNGRTLSVLNNGKVLIGTTDQTVDAKLAVKGVIKATEIKVETLASNNVEVDGSICANSIKVATNNQTADFVFDDNYNLKTLAEIEQYIKEHKHLPNIPSAKEMETNGVDLAEMNKLLLQKIEELTLYVIKLEEKDTERNMQFDCLQKEIEIVKQALGKSLQSK